jgi:ATP-dependent RNA helicase RhlE
VDAGRKRELLAHLVKSNDWKQVLVFVKTKHGANRLAEQLVRNGVEADAIHGNKSQNARTKALAQFKEGSMRVLVATDIAARGLDIEALPHVVNFDLPHVAEDYIHRIGRTGRAGSEGEAVSLVSHEDRPLMAAIERMMNRKVEQRIIAGFEPGSAPLVRDEEFRRPQQQQRHRRPQQGRASGQPQGRGNGGQPQPRGGQPPGRGNGSQPQGERSGQPQRGNGQSRGPQRIQQRGPQPRHNGSLPQSQDAMNSQRDEQIREARARMKEEGESVPAIQPQPGRNEGHRPQGARPEGRNGGRNDGGRRGGGRNPATRGGPQQHRSPGRSSRQQQWDPRRSEPQYSEPSDHQQPRADPKRPAPVIQHRQRKSLVGFVGALLGRKKDEEKS